MFKQTKRCSIGFSSPQAIHQYKEVEFKDWNEENLKTIARIKALGFSTSDPLLNAPLSSRLSGLIDSGDSAFQSKSEASYRFLSQSEFANEPHGGRPSNNVQQSTQSSIQQSIDQSVCQPANQSTNQQFAVDQQCLTVGQATNGECSSEDFSARFDKEDDGQSCDRKTAFRIIPEVHILDLRKDGYIKPHVDAVRFCGSRIVGVSLLSDAIMRLASTEEKSATVDALLKRRSLYLMADFARFNCTHEILADEESIFKGQHIGRDRRISIIARCMPDKNVQEKL